MKKLLPRFVVFLSLLTLWPQLFAATVANELYLTKRNSANTANQQVVIQSDTGKFLRADGTAQTISGGGNMLTTSNLSDLASAATSRTNLGVYSQAEVAALRNALAPAQALSFNGTAGSTATLASAVGTSSASISVRVLIPSTNPAGDVGIFSIGANGAGEVFSAYISSNGKLNCALYGTTASDYRLAQTDASIVASLGGTVAEVTIVRDSSVPSLTIYANNVSLSKTDSTGGTPPTWAGTMSSTTVYIGKFAASSGYYTGTLRLLGIENRALSAAEVLSVYQTGSWPSSHSNNAGQTLTPTPSTAGTFSSGPTVTTTSASGTGGAGAGYFEFYGLDSLWKSGHKFSISFTVNSVSGGTVTLKESTTGVTFGNFSTTGAKSFDVTATTTTGGFYIELPNGVAVNLSSLLITPRGLLVAPDPTQLGSGTSWYDVSGNNATITLGSGVEFVNKWSGTLPPISGTTSITNTSPSTGVGTGALQVAGGIYAGAASVFGGSVTAASLATTQTAAAAAAVVSTHKVPIVLNGTTYYVLLTNVP